MATLNIGKERYHSDIFNAEEMENLIKIFESLSKVDKNKQFIRLNGELNENQKISELQTAKGGAI